jgi:hypothetical protein
MIMRKIEKKTAQKKAVGKKTQVKNKTAVKKKSAAKQKAAVRTRSSPVKTNRKSNAGGPRKGAGRKEGAATKKTRTIADKLAEEDGLTPLEYMLGVLRETPEQLKEQHAAGSLDDAEYMIKLKELMVRRDWAAEKAAPYLHPRLSSTEANVDVKGQDFWQREFAREDAENRRNG